MVRIIGNQSERVRLQDLGDVVYYRQVKEYTDQEFESSKDLQKAIRDSQVVVVAREGTNRGSIPEGHVAVPSQNGINAQDLRRIIREETNRESLKDVVPALMDLIRQELSGFSQRASFQKSDSEREGFVEPAFAPDVSTEGMKANINPESREITSDVSFALAALRKLKQGSSQDLTSK